MPTKNAGISLVEIVIGAAIIAGAILATITAYTTYVQYALANQYNAQVAYMGEEGLETMDFLRDESWTTHIGSLSTTSTYYLSWTGLTWSLVTTTVPYIDGVFLRTVTISDVERNSSDQIATNGSYDPNTKKITVSLTYFVQHATTTKTFSAYITNLWNN